MFQFNILLVNLHIRNHKVQYYSPEEMWDTFADSLHEGDDHTSEYGLHLLCHLQMLLDLESIIKREFNYIK